MVGRFLITASLAAMIGAAPALAAKSQQPVYIPPSGQSDTQQGTNGGQKMQNGSQAEQGKKVIQPNGEATGNLTGQNQPGEKSKKIMQPSQQTGEQTGDQGTGQKTKKKLQQNTQEQQNAQSKSEGQQATGQPGEKTKKIEQRQAGQSSEQMTTGATGKVTEIPAEKKTVIRDKIITTNVEKVERTRISINISVGVIVPNTIRLHRVPEEVIRIVPAYSGFMFFVLDDGSIVFVEPGTLRIVYVLTA